MSDLLTELTTVLGDERVSVEWVDRLAYAHDTFPLALKNAESHHQAYLPDGIVFPKTTQEVSQVIHLAHAYRTPIHIFGGGSGIVGGALAVHGGIMLETKGLDTIFELDPISNLVTVGAGINGQRLEDYLNAHGFILGHYPQSLRSSTLGGWIAHRATGTASSLYGGIEELITGMEVVLPSGEILLIRSTPRSATGPDLRQLLIGAEGTCGVVTRATLRIRPSPEERHWLVYSFPDMEIGLTAIRHVIQKGLRPAIVRLYDDLESAHLSGMEQNPEKPCVLIIGCEGDREQVVYEATRVSTILLGAGGSAQTTQLAENWWKDRFNTRGLLKTLRVENSIADALEVSGSWRILPDLYRSMQMAMEAAIHSHGDSGIVYGHCSHVYPDGGNLYMIFHATSNESDNLSELYKRILDAAFIACVQVGGSISHHHGIGLGKAQWMKLELGQCGIEVLQSIQQALDPDRLLNPGKLGAMKDA